MSTDDTTDNTTLQTSLDYISSRLTNVTVTEDYILKLCANSQIQSNNTDTTFYQIFLLLFAIYPNFSWLSIPYMSKSEKWTGSLAKFFLMIVCILVLQSAFNTVPEDCNKNTQLVKNIIFPLIVLIAYSVFIMIYTFSVGGKNKKGFLVFWILLIVAISIYLIINCVDLYANFISYNLKYLPKMIFYIIIGIILIVQYVNYHKSSAGLWRGEIMGYSFPLLIGFVLLLGRVFKLINMTLMTVNNKNTSLESNTDSSFSYTTTINTHMNNIIEKLDITGFTGETLYDKLTEYKVTEGANSFYILKYLGSAIMSLGIYFLTGKLIKDNLNDPSLEQQAFPIIGFCNSLFTTEGLIGINKGQIDPGKECKNDVIEDIFNNPVNKHIIGTIATKTLFTSYSSNNETSPGTMGWTIFLGGIKAMLIPFFGGKIRRWYEGITAEENGILSGFLKLLYAGLDYDRTKELFNQNMKKKIICKDFVYSENNILKMVLYFICGLGLTALFGMNYYTSDANTGLILNGVKIVIVGIIIAIVRNKMKKKINKK